MRRTSLRGMMITAAALVGFLCASSWSAEDFQSRWSNENDRVWLGEDYWANPMEDWLLRGGRIECTSSAPGRNVHILTRQLAKPAGAFELSVRTGRVSGSRGAVGFEVGIHDQIVEYRSNCIFGTGVKAYVTTTGQVVVGPRKTQLPGKLDFDGLTLKLSGRPAGEDHNLSLVVVDAGGETVGSLSAKVASDRLEGNIAIIHNPPGIFPAPAAKKKTKRRRPAGRADAKFWFADWKVSGEELRADASHRFGPILWAMHTVSDSRGPDGYVMKMTALLPPMGSDDSQQVQFQLKDGDDWKDAGDAALHSDAYTATFRLPKWNVSKNVPYRLVYSRNFKDGSKRDHHWTGTVRKEPKERPFVLGGLTCQFHTGFPYEPVVRNLEKLDPDMLFFSGDQLYENSGGFGIIRTPADRAILNYLRKYYMFGWAFGDVMRDRPTVCIPDDHDVFQGNIWGEGGAKMKEGSTSSSGGYIEPVRMVEVVHRTNCSHHPKFFDPTPIKQQMSVYYGDMVYGGVSFAVLGDRQFKSGPEHVDTKGKRADHLTDPSVDVASLDKPGLELLGKRQEDFLRHWVADWRNADMKVLLSETVFSGAATHHGSRDGYLIADLDSGAWPQTPRNRALRILRKGRPLHVNGDQHLTTLIQYGIDGPRDASWSFCTPAISVGYQRWWRPEDVGNRGANRPAHNVPYTGEYTDGFGHPIYVYAVGNPEGSRHPNRYQQAHIKASGFGIVRIDHDQRTYRCESYRFLIDADPSNPDHQFPGFPHTIKQSDNDGRKPVAWLPKLSVRGTTDPVLRVYSEPDGKLVYAFRIKGTSHEPAVYEQGTYRIEIGEPGAMKSLKGVKATAKGAAEPIDIEF